MQPPPQPGIYRFTNMINGKVYIGKSFGVYGRKNNHISQLRRNKHKNKGLQTDWNQYGEINFQWEVIQTCRFKSCLDYYETMFIALHQSSDPKYGYNLTTGGRRGVLSETSIEQGAAKRRGRKFTAEHKAKLSAAKKGKSSWNKGKKFSDEVKAKMSVARSGEKHHNFGKRLSQTVKDKIAASHIGIRPNEETRKKQSNAKKGMKWSQEVVDRRAASIKLTWQRRKKELAVLDKALRVEQDVEAIETEINSPEEHLDETNS